MVWRHDGLEELMVQGKGSFSAYNLGAGEPKWWARGCAFSAVTTPVAGDGLLFAGGSGMGDPTGPDDPLFDWKKLVADFDAIKDGQIDLAADGNQRSRRESVFNQRLKMDKST